MISEISNCTEEEIPLNVDSSCKNYNPCYMDSCKSVGNLGMSNIIGNDVRVNDINVESLV